VFELAHVRFLYGFFNKGVAIVRLMFRTAADYCCIAVQSFLCGGTEKGFATSSWFMQVGVEASDFVPWSLV
jgi:hypothetical protein